MGGDDRFGGSRAGFDGLALARRLALALGVAAAAGWWLAPSLYSWAYLVAGSDYGVNVVAYPTGYTGAGGTVRVTVGIDPASPHARAMVQPVRNVVATLNGLRPTMGNLVADARNDVPENHIDFESVALHEVGHALGLAHPNVGTESDLPEEQQDYTQSTTGPNGRFDLDPGADSVIGSSDDVRGDDVNLHWFRRSNNNPFTIAATVDSSTYRRDTAALPAGHRFAANAGRAVGAGLGVAATEAVMQQGTYPDEAQRTLAHDDVAGLRYAMSGLDGRAGTADDYVLVLEYAGLDDAADIVIGFDDDETRFAVAKSRASLSGNHAYMLETRVYFNDSYNWFFGAGDGGDGPDLVVRSPAVSDRTLAPGRSFTFSAAVRNIGDTTSAATILSYRRRPSGGSFTIVDTVPVSELPPSGASEQSVLLTAPTHVGSYEYEACVAEVGGESDTENNCSTIVSVTVVGVGSCTNDLGLASGTVTRSGAWDGSCSSAHDAGGRYARYYSFRLAASASVTIDLMSPVDPFLALRNGSGTGGLLIEEDDDGGPGANAQIVRTLAAGAYTVEATTFAPRQTGPFTLTMTVGPAGPDLVVASPAVSQATLASGQDFTFSATVRNQGDQASPATTLTYRQRGAGEPWTVAGTDSVRALSPSGSSVESILLTAPSRAGAYDHEACVSTVAGESDTGNNCSGAIRVVVHEPPDLVVETPTISDSSLTSGESFTLSAGVRNQGGTASEAATLTWRRRRPGGAWVTQGTSAVGRLSPSGTSRESIGLTAPAQAGAYEYGACVSTVRWEREAANNCSESVQAKVCAVERLGSVALGARTVGSWDSGCESTHRPGSYARYYSFVLTRAVEVAMSLSSSTDAYLFLLAGAGTDGRVVASNDDIGGGDVDSRIVGTLSAGAYTVEATTASTGATGSFTLRVTERRPFTDDPLEAGWPIKAVHLTELRGRIDELRVGAGLPRYSWTNRTIRPGATPVRAVHWRQLRAALDEVYDADGRRRPRYTGEIRLGAPIEAGHVDELRRAVEGL